MSYSTHRYLIVHTWVGLKHSDTVGHIYTGGERGGGAHKTGGNGNGGGKKLKLKRFW